MADEAVTEEVPEESAHEKHCGECGASTEWLVDRQNGELVCHRCGATTLDVDQAEEDEEDDEEE